MVYFQLVRTSEATGQHRGDLGLNVVHLARRAIVVVRRSCDGDEGRWDSGHKKQRNVKGVRERERRSPCLILWRIVSA